MKPSISGVILLALLPRALPAQGAFAFTDVSVVPMDEERVLPGQTVVVRDGRIVALGAAGRVPVPADATRIDGRGRYLIPGLAEMHGHLPAERSQAAEDILFLYVANGVTTVRGMQGAPGQLAMREAIARGELLGPRLYVSSPSMGGGRAADVATAEGLVREYRAAGYDHVKVHEGLSGEVYDAIARTARALGIPFAGHVTNAVSAFHAMEAGQASIDHLDNMLEAVDADVERIPELVRAAVRSHTGVVPTQVLWETAFLLPPPPEEILAERTELRYVPPAQVSGWVRAQEASRGNVADLEERRRIVEARRRLIKALYDGGALLLLGTDSPQRFSVPGFSTHREMRVMVASGLTPYQVLVTGTRNIATYFGTEAEAGTVAVGKRADLILLEADPRADVANVARRAGVMVHGRWLAEREIAARLEAIAARHGR